MKKYIAEYILNTRKEWNVYMKYGRGTKTGPMSEQGLLNIEAERKRGDLIILSVEVIEK